MFSLVNMLLGSFVSGLYLCIIVLESIPGIFDRAKLLMSLIGKYCTSTDPLSSWNGRS